MDFLYKQLTIFTMFTALCKSLSIPWCSMAMKSVLSRIQNMMKMSKIELLTIRLTRSRNAFQYLTLKEILHEEVGHVGQQNLADLFSVTLVVSPVLLLCCDVAKLLFVRLIWNTFKDSTCDMAMDSLLSGTVVSYMLLCKELSRITSCSP